MRIKAAFTLSAIDWYGESASMFACVIVVETHFGVTSLALEKAKQFNQSGITSDIAALMLTFGVNGPLTSITQTSPSNFNQCWKLLTKAMFVKEWFLRAAW